MAAPVVVRFQVEGVDAVQRAFRTVEDAVVRGETNAVQVQARSSRERVSTADREARDKVRLLDREAREKIAAMKAADRAVDAAGKAGVREAEKNERDKTRIVAQAEKEKARLAEAGNRDKERAMARLASDASRWAREDVRNTERAEAEKTRIAERAAKERSRFAATVTGAGIAGARAGMSRIGGIAAGVAGVALGLGGGFSIADSLQGTMSLQRNAALLANSAYIPGQNKRVDPASLVARARASSITTGLDANELIEGTRGYVAKSADLKGGLANMDFFGRVAKSTGSKFSDVTNAAGILRVQNKNLGEKEMKQLILDVVMQGKQGSVEMSDLAGSAGKIARTSSSYAGSQTENQRKLLGLSQIAMRTSGSVGEASTVMSNISADAMKHSTTMAAVLGKDAFNAKGQVAKGPDDFLADVMTKTGGNLQKIQAMGFGARSMKMFQALAPTFNEAEAAGGGVGTKSGTKAGREAVMADMKAVTGATYSEKELGEDFKNIITTPAEQFEAALRQLKDELGSQLLPEFVKLVPTIKELVPVFVDLTKTALPAFVDFIKSVAEFANQNRDMIHNIAAHPIGAIMAKEVTASIVKAGLGELLGKVLQTSLGSQGAISISTATMAITAAVLTVQKLAADDDAVVRGGNEALTGSANARGILRSGAESGTLTPEELAKAKEKQATLIAGIKANEGNKGGGSLFFGTALLGGMIADGATMGLAGSTKDVLGARKDRTATDERQIKSQKDELEKLTKSIIAAQKALEKMAASAKVNDPARVFPIGSPERAR